MLKKKIIRITILILSLLITGCLNYTQITTIKTDNSGEMFVHYWIHWHLKEDSLRLRNQNLFIPDSIKSVFKCKANNISNVEVYADNQDSTLHGKVNFTFTNFDSLKFAKAFTGVEFSITNGKGKTKIFKQSLPEYISNFGFQDSSAEIRYIYYLPGNIISTNASSFSNNKLIWNFTSENLSKLKYLKAEYIPFRLKETPHIIYFLTFLIMAIVLYYLLRKNKNVQM